MNNNALSAAYDLMHMILCMPDVVCESRKAIDSGISRFFRSNSGDFKRRTLAKFAQLVRAQDNTEFQRALQSSTKLRNAINYVLNVYDQMQSIAAEKVADLNGDYDQITSADFMQGIQNRTDTSEIANDLVTYKRFVQNELRNQAKNYVNSPEGKTAIAEPEDTDATQVTAVDVDAAALPTVDSKAFTEALAWISGWLRSGTNVNKIATLPGFHVHMASVQAAFAEQFINYAIENVSTSDIQAEYYELMNPNVQHFDNLMRLIREGERANASFLKEHQYAAIRLGPYMPLSYIYNIMRKYNLTRGQAFIRYCYSLGKIAEDLTAHLQSIVKAGPRSTIRI